MGLGDLEVFHHPVLDRIIAGIKRTHGEPERRERLPITRNILIKLLRKLDTTNEVQATLHAAYSIAFAAFLRAGELTYKQGEMQDSSFDSWHLTRKSVDLQADRIILSLLSSKTDPFRRGRKIYIAATNDEACSITSIRNLFTRFPKPASSPLFQFQDKAFTREYLVQALRSGLRAVGVRGNYSGHSFRRGAATTAKNSGLLEEDIQTLGRWKADSYQLYIQTHLDQLIATSLRFQRPPATFRTAPP